MRKDTAVLSTLREAYPFAPRSMLNGKLKGITSKDVFYNSRTISLSPQPQRWSSPKVPRQDPITRFLPAIFGKGEPQDVTANVYCLHVDLIEWIRPISYGSLPTGHLFALPPLSWVPPFRPFHMPQGSEDACHSCLRLAGL